MEFCKKCDIAYELISIIGCPLCEAKDRIEELEENLSKDADREMIGDDADFLSDIGNK